MYGLLLLSNMQNVQDVVAVEFEKHNARLLKLETLNDQLAGFSAKLTDQSLTITDLESTTLRLETKLAAVESKNRDLVDNLKDKDNVINKLAVSLKTVQTNCDDAVDDCEKRVLRHVESLVERRFVEVSQRSSRMVTDGTNPLHSSGAGEGFIERGNLCSNSSNNKSAPK